MSLIKCKECGGDVAKTATACPKCGAPLPKRSKWLVGCASVVVAFAVLAGLGAALKPPASSTSPQSPTTFGGEALPQPAIAKAVSLPQLLSEYHDNELRADGAFKGKLIETTGVVTDVKKDIMGSPYVVVGTGKPFEMPALQCMLAKDQAGAASQLQKGQKVTVRGTVSGLMVNVLAQDCSVR